MYLFVIFIYDRELWTGPGGKPQWRIGNKSDSDPDIMMFTTDVALLTDANFRAEVEKFASDEEYLTQQFSAAWYKLTSRDMGPATRCQGDIVAPPQPFQSPLPPPPASLPNFNDVKTDIITTMYTENSDILPFDSTGSYGPLFVRLAWQCFNTFRATDYAGGCNGARIRFSPQIDWYASNYLDKALQLLIPVKDKYGDSLTWADLIVLSGTTALEDAASKAGSTISISFYGGRSDAVATEPPQPSYLELRLKGGQDSDTLDVLNDVMLVFGLSKRQMVVLMGGGHSIGQMHMNRSGFNDGSWTLNPAALNNEWFRNILNLDWTSGGTSPNIYYSAVESTTQTTLYMTKTDMLFMFDPDYKAIIQEYALDNALFLSEFANAWAAVMNADMYTVDTTDPIPTSDSSDGGSDSNMTAVIVLAVFLAIALVIIMALLIKTHFCRATDDKSLLEGLSIKSNM